MKNNLTTLLSVMLPLLIIFFFRDVCSPAASMAVLVYPTRINKLFHARARNIGLETDVKLKWVAIFLLSIITDFYEKKKINYKLKKKVFPVPNIMGLNFEKKEKLAS